MSCLYQSHFFLDDRLIFCKTNSLEWSKIIHILETCEKGSGQILNKEKTSIFFTRNTPKDIQQTILKIAGVKSQGFFEKYLGLSAVVERAKVADFHSLIDKTWARITNWRTKFLSTIGKKILLKYMPQAIPTYIYHGNFPSPSFNNTKASQTFEEVLVGIQ